MIPYRARPSLGFVLSVIVAVTTVAFFAWGLATPPLDELRRLHIELETGERGPLQVRERTLIEKSLQRYPDLAAAWLDGRAVGIISRHEGGLVDNGYAYLIRSKASRAMLEVSLAVGQEPGATVSARVGDRHVGGTLVAERPWRWPLVGGTHAELVEVLITSDRQKRPPPVLVRVLEAP
jgi:hypothetical protein